MAAVGRESHFMPTVKCSTCGLQVEISLMGEHICAGSGSPAETTPPLPSASLFGRLMPSFGNPLAPKQQPRTPPQVDTSAANRAFANQGQETPLSVSSMSQNSISPLTPNGGPGAGEPNEIPVSPAIADSPPPATGSTRPGGYGGLGDNAGLEGLAAPPADAPRKQSLSLKERMDAMRNTSSPFDPGRRPSAASQAGSTDASERPGTSASNTSGSLGVGRMPKAPVNGYVAFGPPPRAPGSMDEPPTTPNRAETFPRPSDRFAPPARTPSAPLPPGPLRPGRPQPAVDPPGVADERASMMSERSRRPSRGPDTSRPPPPRTSGLVRPTTPNVPTINLAEEFGIGNPYHAPSESTSSSNSGNSSQAERRPSQASQASSRTSPPRSLSSRSGKSPSDTPSFDNLVSDIQSSMEDLKPKTPVVAPLRLPSRDMSSRPPPLSARPPRTGDRGYDPRIDPAVQNPRSARGRSPLPSPIPPTPLQESLAVQPTNDALSPSTTGVPSPRWTRSPEGIEERRPSQAQPGLSTRSQTQPPPQLQPPLQAMPPPPPPQARPRTRSRSRSRPREPVTHSSRGNCKACGLPIKGKSISSADGRLTGRYHKPCFVCSTCQEPFATSTFYVIDDRPYCELHYHRLNGSLCGSCGRGIEGQYLEDESAVKHHVGCFKCGECGMALRDGYFEVNGKAYCEKDAWKLAGGGYNPLAGGLGSGPPGGGGLRPPYMGLPGGPRNNGGYSAYNPSRLGPMGQGPRPRMEKRMTRLGMM